MQVCVTAASSESPPLVSNVDEDYQPEEVKSPILIKEWTEDTHGGATPDFRWWGWSKDFFWGGVEFSIPRFFWVGKFDKTSIFLDIQSNLKIRVSARVW